MELELGYINDGTWQVFRVRGGGGNLTSVSVENFFRSRVSVAILAFAGFRYEDAVRRFENVARDQCCDQIDRADVVPHLVDGKDAPNDHFMLGRHETGHHQARAVAQHQFIIDIQGLKERNDFSVRRSMYRVN